MAKVLIACATSGIALDAFLARGHDALQCDLLPADQLRHSNRHIVGDVREVVKIVRPDLLFVSNPPCTRLCESGQRWLFGPNKTHPKQLPRGRTWQSMIDEFNEGVEIFEACLHAPVPFVAVENPKMNIHAREAIKGLPTPQIVQPWWFGDPFFKGTGMYTRGLPDLVPTNKLTPPERGTEEYKQWSAIHRTPPGPDRWKVRSKTPLGMARAWAEQYGDYVDLALAEAA